MSLKIPRRAGKLKDLTVFWEFFIFIFFEKIHKSQSSVWPVPTLGFFKQLVVYFMKLIDFYFCLINVRERDMVTQPVYQCQAKHHVKAWSVERLRLPRYGRISPSQDWIPEVEFLES